MAAFVLQWQNWVAEVEMRGLQSLNYLLSGPLWKKFTTP